MLLRGQCACGLSAALPLLLLLGWHPSAGQTRTITQSIELVWPLVLFEVQVELPKLEVADTEAARRARLAAAAEEGLKRYVEEVQPEEFVSDPAWKERYEGMDSARKNDAFLRWQKRVYSKISGTPWQELDWDGSPNPLYEKVSYDWDDLHRSKDTKALVSSIKNYSRKYLQYVQSDNKD